MDQAVNSGGPMRGIFSLTKNARVEDQKKHHHSSSFTNLRCALFQRGCYYIQPLSTQACFYACDAEISAQKSVKLFLEDNSLNWYISISQVCFHEHEHVGGITSHRWGNREIYNLCFFFRPVGNALKFSRNVQTKHVECS